MKRYIEQFSHAGEIVLFDRSWYNRAMVEPVMGFCSGGSALELTDIDLQAQDLWDEVTEQKKVLLQKTNTKRSKWRVIRSDDKHLARKETMKQIFCSVKYLGRSRTLSLTPDPDIVIPGDRELKIMKMQQKRFGIPLR